MELWLIGLWPKDMAQMVHATYHTLLIVKLSWAPSSSVSYTLLGVVYNTHSYINSLILLKIPRAPGGRIPGRPIPLAKL